MRPPYVALLFLLLATAAQAQTASVEGRVVNAETGEPLANVPVDLRSVYNTTPRVWRTTHTAADGSFALEDLPNETPHRIRAVVAGPTADFILITPPFRPDTTTFFTLGYTLSDTAMPEPTFRFVPDPSASKNTIGGTVYDAATGLPMPDATVTIHAAGAGEDDHVLHTDSTGRYVQAIQTPQTPRMVSASRIGYSLLQMANFVLHEPGYLNFYVLEVKTWMDDLTSPIGYVKHANAVSAQGDRPAFDHMLEVGSMLRGALHLKEDAPTMLTGQILAGEAPAPGATVDLIGTPYTAVTDSDGRFVLGELPAGLYRFRIVYGSTEETTPQLLLTRGPNDFTFTLDAVEN